MEKDGILEIVEFFAVEGSTEQQVTQGIQVLEEFYRHKDGYAGLRVAQEKDGRWVLVLEWASVDAERNASTAMMQSPETLTFKQVVDPKTVSKRLLQQKFFL